MDSNAKKGFGKHNHLTMILALALLANIIYFNLEYIFMIYFKYCGVFCRICVNQTLFLSGLYYTSATFTATMQNLTPALTFGIAVSLGCVMDPLK